MRRAVMLSIRPEWVKKILSGEKTLEIRRTKPKLDVPFKCYIYQTKGGGVVGEFVCDYIHFIDDSYNPKKWIRALSCMSTEQIREYSDYEHDLFAWNISKLKVYDNPKLLSDFRRYKETKSWCLPVRLTKAPQSWCYVEELT